MSEDQFEILKMNSNYEIEKQHPHRIRKIGKDRFLTEYEDCKGYLCVQLNSQKYSKHRLIALQFIKNDDPDTKTEIDHINRIKTDNRIENLRWVSHQENTNNRGKYIRRPNEYLDEFPEHTIEISEFNGYDFEELYFDILENRILKVMNSGRLKVIKPILHGNLLRISLTDIHNKWRHISYEKLIRTCRRIAIDLEDLQQQRHDEDDE